MMRRSAPCRRTSSLMGTGSFGAALLGLFDQIEQPTCIRAREGAQTVRLSLFYRVLCSHALGAKLRCLLLHQILPSHWVQLPDEHVDAHFGDGLDVRRSCLPQIPWERSDRQEVLRIQRGHVK